MSEDSFSGAGVLARVLRNGVVESVHLGDLVIIDPHGKVKHSIGNPEAVIFPRSSLKPLQLVAAMRNGFDPDDSASLALAASSHNGEQMHIDGVRKILASAGLDESALDNTPDYPLDPEAAFAWRAAGGQKASVAQNCSGKHSAMVAACVASGYDVADYRNPEHPLQKNIAEVVHELTEDLQPPRVVVDGCGAPAFSTTLTGLARAFSKLATAEPGTNESRIAAAMASHPEMVGGTGRDVTASIRAVPGLICKDGAEGVYAGALPDGTAFAVKVLDGSGRARPTILARVLELAGAANILGADVDTLRAVGTVPVLGHGDSVGRVEPGF
jgi:L-asparaginase II